MEQKNFTQEKNEYILAANNVEHLKAKPWGFWATVGFSAIIAVAYLFFMVIIVLGFIIVEAIKNPKLDIEAYGKSLTEGGLSGLFLSFTAIVGLPVVVGLVLLFAKIRKKITIKEYLSLNKVGFGKILVWIISVILLAICSDALSILLGRPIVPNFMENAYRTAVLVPLLWAAVVIASPFWEEILFRGFIFKGLQHSKVGSFGAILLTALVWSLIHTQYDLYGIATIFVGGLLLGLARLKTNSVYIPIAMHSVINLIATLECAIVVAQT